MTQSMQKAYQLAGEIIKSALSDEEKAAKKALGHSDVLVLHGPL